MRSSIVCLLVFSSFVTAQTPAPRTAAEKTNYQETTRHADVIAFGEQLAKLSPRVKATTYGTSKEGRPLPLLIVSADGVDSPQAAARANKLVLLVYANIHAGEVDGKEAVLALARDLAVNNDALLKGCVILVAPDINPDGNEKIGPDNRPGQNGPALAGVRENADGLDLNRDFIKLESPEIRSLVKLITAWDPLLMIDCHTTNGSKHRYTLTYDGQQNPAADSRLIAFSNNTLFPDVTKRLKAATGFESFFYGNFNKDRTQWTSYPATPRFGTQYVGLRNRVPVLSESYTYASFADRVKASYHFVKSTFESVAEKPDVLRKLTREANTPTRIALRSKATAHEKPATVLGFDADAKPKDFELQLVTNRVPTLEVEVPEAYLVPPAFAEAVDTLRRHGIAVEELREDIDLDLEAYRVTEASAAAEAFQKHKTRQLEVTREKVARRVPPNTFVVRTAQPLGRLAAFLLEPQAEDGLTTWNFFDAGIAKDKEFPVVRVPKLGGVATGQPRPLPEDRKKNLPFDLGFLTSNRSFAVGEIGPVTWLSDGDHFLQSKANKLWKVAARTGRSEMFVDAGKLEKSLEGLPAIQRQARGGFARGGQYRMNPARTATLVDLPKGELGIAYFDGTPGMQLTTSDGKKEFVTFSPTGTHIAFVRAGNLFAVDIATRKETALTTDGGGELLNGRADWVYEEEIFNRNGQSYWWNADGSAITFLRFDDTPVKKYTLADPLTTRGRAEVYAYPKPGDPNPIAKIGVVRLADAKPVFLPLGEYKPDDTLFARVGFLPNGKQVFAYVQNRRQTWLDFVVWDTPESSPRVLFRDQTKAWIDDMGEPKFLADGSFLFPSERTGWKHLYHYDPQGKLIRAVTSGEWEARDVHRVSEADGVVYFSGTKDGTNGANLYAAKLDGSGVTRLSAGDGTHTVSVAPKGNLFTDRFTDNTTPGTTLLRELGGGVVRTLDNNPAYAREEYRFGNVERLQVPMKDGFQLEAAITYPPDFDPTKKYPVWISTYAGPHAPTVKDAWSWRGFEQVLAHMGVVSFRVDPRSASGKGAVSAWACYKQMGVPELKDLEEAVDWITAKPWADSSRVGISGHSFGGFITAYALTHSKKFAAGIAGAPPTDWRLYDTIYTERYMGLPDENKAGYDKTSVVKAAGNLHGKLLLIHGLMDDNVHVQNSMQLVDALQKANKPFELMIYPPSRHGIRGEHYQTLQIDFIRRTMLGAK
ncbi:DPP IV N-terminal domain-containing protein [Limnoglobus roseus]|uniref:Peptidase M14 n=1 Tax=Limnoglobus roseus TaxID=2598579 RepID=A0A5C1AKW8_9BACT|nr:DPP IV N-terminal domain-containing protein [Limnoglobus roseus]QEL20029.1 peptidase M14 [Limnoglobus roseus]